MCSLTIPENFSKQLEEKHNQIESRLHRFAEEADTETPGALDYPRDYLRAPFPQELRNAGVRKKRVGDHRVFYTGQHTDCNYTPFYVKWDKKGDNWAEDDNNPAFHQKLENALMQKSNIARTLPEPERPEEEYKKQAWYKSYMESLSNQEVSEE